MSTLKMQLVALGCLATLLAVAVPAGAAITSLTVNRCLSGKVKAVGKTLAARTNCLSKDAKRGTPDPTCLQKASDKFTGDGNPASGAFEKLETRFPNTDPTPCLTFDDQSAFEGDIATYAASVPMETGSATGRCDAVKIKCTGKYVSAIASCFAKAAKSTGTVDGACTAKAAAKLFGAGRGCLDKAVARGDCTHASNQGFDLQIGADAFLRSTTCALDPTNPGCGCPTSYTFTANGSDADLDVGWTGANHDGDMPSMSRLTLLVSGCPNPTSPCGTCTLSGPISNPGGPSFANRRCRGDDGGANGTWIPCVSDSDCVGTNNACVFFFGPPRPDHLGFGELCTLTEIAGSIAGAVDPDSGTSTLTVPLTTRTYAAGTIDDPCPMCTAGTCSAGPRVGMACTVQGHGAIFGEDVSLDCPPFSAARVDARTFAITLGTGTQVMTLDGASPFCRAGGFTADRCFCDTCNNANAEGCTSDAACPPSGGNPGICGGKRCLGGSNTGAPCVVSSECSGGGCAVPGMGTAPNQCDDGICTPNTPPDLASTNEGTCASGPVETVCSSQTYRVCATASDCPVPGDTCIARPRDCFTTNGQLGDTVSAGGQADPVAPTLATLYCTGPTTARIINSIRGLPGLVRYTIPGVVTTN